MLKKIAVSLFPALLSALSYADSSSPPEIVLYSSDYPQTYVKMDKTTRKIIGDALDKVSKLRIVANEWTTDKTAILLVPYVDYVNIVKQLPLEKDE